MSLRTKFMLALLLTGLAAVAIVGGLAFIGMTTKVDSIRRERAVENFHAAAGAYLAQYGSWQASPGKRGFDAVMLSREPAGGPSPLPTAGPARSRAAVASRRTALFCR